MRLYTGMRVCADSDEKKKQRIWLPQKSDEPTTQAAQKKKIPPCTQKLVQGGFFWGVKKHLCFRS